MLTDIAKTIIFVGIALVGLGCLFYILSKVPGMGRLPGDLVVKRDDLTFYFPLTTSILLSITLSLILYLFNKR